MKKLKARRLVVCSRGHTFYKSSSCPVCPKCWPGYRKKLQSDFPEKLSAPALRALNNAKIKKIAELKNYSIVEISKLHGMGPKAISMLQLEMKKRKVDFKQIKPMQTVGQHIVYHKDGSIWAKGKIVKGVGEGYWEWYRKDGSLMRSGHFHQGKNVGEWITYDKAGKVVKISSLDKKRI